MANEALIRKNTSVLEGVSSTRARLKYMGTNGLNATTVSFVRNGEDLQLEAISPIRPLPRDVEKTLGVIALEAMNQMRAYKQAAE